MSREKQIEGIKDHIDSIYGCDCAYYGVDGLAIATELYNAGYRKQSEDVTDTNVGGKSEWISVEERFPEETGRAYLVWDNVQATVKKRFFHRIPLNMPVETYPYIREYFGNVSDYKRYTHWMPLPEAPKMKGGAG